MKHRTYSPRRASVTRWLAGAPHAVLDCFDHGEKAEPDRFTIILGKEFMQESHRGHHIGYLYCGPDPRGYSGSGEFLAHECSAFRHRSGHHRTRWDALPEAVRAFVIRWTTPEEVPAPVTPPTGPVDPLMAFLSNPKPYNAATLERSMRVFIERWGPDYVGNLSVEIRGEGVGGPDLKTILVHCIEHPPELEQLRRAVDLMISGWERAKMMDLIAEREATPSPTPKEAPDPRPPTPATP